MKRAHDGCVSCKRFQTLVMNFVDDELPDAERSDVLSHAAGCPTCRESIIGAGSVRKALSSRPRESVRPEFDFRLKSGIRLESRRLESLSYRFRLFLRENTFPIIGIPAAAAIMLAVYLSSGSLLFKTVDVRVAGERIRPQTEMMVPAGPADPSAEDIHYVLESVELSEVGLGNLPETAGERPQDTRTISLLNF